MFQYTFFFSAKGSHAVTTSIIIFSAVVVVATEVEIFHDMILFQSKLDTWVCL